MTLPRLSERARSAAGRLERGGRAPRDAAPTIVGALAIATGIALALGLSAREAEARPGGGGTFSGGSGRSSGGGSGGGGGSGDAELFILLLRLCFEHPVIGIPLMVVVVGYVVVRSKARSSYKGWESGVARTAAAGPSIQGPAYAAGAPPPRARIRRELERLRATDENFSIVLLEDFLYALYAEVHTARGQGRVAALSAYLTPRVVAMLSAAQTGPVRNVVVGAMKFVGFQMIGGAPPEVSIQVEFEANYTEGPPGGERAYYLVERWTLARRQGVKSRTPDRVRVFGCPGCGAPQEAVFAGTCRYCQSQMATGDLDWVLRGVELLHREARPPMLTSDTPERGTNEPTIVDPEAAARLAQLNAKDPSFAWPAFQARVGLIFATFQQAWSARDLARMRPFLSDALFQAQTYWIEAYRAQRLRNVTENARILDIQLARVTSDRFFDAITVRVFATGLDYTISDVDGRVVSGSRSRERKHTEYWTLIRGASRTGPTRTDAACPNCGAPMQINMAGHCQYCKAKVTSGEFDWVLSRIEQDEVYEG